MRLNQNNNGQNTCGQASGQPTRLLHADGYVDVSAQVPVFYYHLKDHLGNVRLVITPAGSSNQPEILQAMEYYPFGMRFESSIPYESDHSHMPNKHTYNSNEEQEMPGRWLDYGFRFYDSQIARFHSVDPLAHSFSSQSPYVYAGNNPILNIDFMGLSAMSNVSNNRTSSFTLGMTDEDFIKATRPIGLEGVESKEKTKKIDKNTESQTSQQNGNGKKKKDGKGNVAKGQGGGEIAKLFGKYNAGYIADVNSNQLFPNQTYDRDKVVTRYMVEGVGVWILGVVNTGLGAVSGGLAVTFQGQEHILRMKTENYLQNGQGLGIYAINVSAPGAFPRAMLFNAVDGSSIGWHHTIVQGAPTMHYHIYLKFLKELNTIR